MDLAATSSHEPCHLSIRSSVCARSAPLPSYQAPCLAARSCIFFFSSSLSLIGLPCVCPTYATLPLNMTPVGASDDSASSTCDSLTLPLAARLFSNAANSGQSQPSSRNLWMIPMTSARRLLFISLSRLRITSSLPSSRSMKSSM